MAFAVVAIAVTGISGGIASIPRNDAGGNVRAATNVKPNEFNLIEAVFDSSEVAKYRDMVMFKDALYILSDTVLRYQRGSAVPEVILENDTEGYYSAAAVYNNTLYIGTLDGDVISLDTNDNATVEFDKLGAVWDMATYKDQLIISTASADGFNLHRIKDESINRFIASDGLGIDKHIAASLFVFNIDGEDYVYVTTLSDTATFIDLIADGNAKDAFNNVYAPAAMYRFYEMDGALEWETIVGEDSNVRAGFFLGDGNNTSQNQSINHMTQYNGKLYASTSDTSVHTNKLIDLITDMFEDAMPPEDVYDILISDGLPFFMDIATLFTDIMKAPFQAVMDVTSKSLEAFTELISTIMETGTDLLDMTINELFELAKEWFTDLFDDIKEAIDEVAAEYPDFMTVAKLTEHYNRIMESYKVMMELLDNEDVMGWLNETAKPTITKIIEIVIAAGPYIIDLSNPEGFDLYESEDGVTWKPVTVSGFGGSDNWGGCVLVPTEYGLFAVGTQVWLLDDTTEFGVTNTASVETTDKVFTFKVQVTMTEDIILDGLSLSISVDGAYALIHFPTIIERTGDIRFNVETVEALGIKYYKETMPEVCTYEYLVTVILPDDYIGGVVITFNDVPALADVEIKIAAVAPAEPTPPPSRVSPGAAAGIAVGCAGIAAIASVLATVYIMRRRALSTL